MTSEENDNENLPRMTDTFSTAGLQHPLSPVGFITFMRTYSRRLDPGDPNSAVETFAQTLERVVRASNTQLGVGFTEEEQREFFLLLYKLKCSVAGRFLWQLGTATVDRLGLLSLQNCALCVIDEPVMPFVWAADCLMLGSGVGFNICPENVDKLPVVQAATVTRCDQNDADFIVPDSREGWIKLLGKVLKAHFYSGKDFTYATICLRSKGAPIKGFGGLASGPEVLCDGINKINTVLNGCAGRKLRPVDALDIMNIIGMIVVSGNVRRSAQIALGSAEDQDYLKAKRWDLGNIPNWRCYSNNSVVANHPSQLTDDFWTGYEGNGEPYGLINLPLSRSCGRLGETQYPDPEVQGFNPCAEQSLANYETCVTGNTRVHTSTGCYHIQDLVGESVQIFNGKVWCEVVPFLARDADAFLKVTFSDGSMLEATPYHEFCVGDSEDGPFQRVPADKLEVGMRIPTFCLPELAGGESVISARFMGLAMSEFTDCDQGLPDGIMSLDAPSILAFADGWAHGALHITSVCEEKLRDMQILLRRTGNNSATLARHSGRGEWVLTMSGQGGENADVGEPVQQTVVSIEDLHKTGPSFCFSEPQRQMGVFGNVLTHQCCLAEIFLPNIESLEELKTAAKYVYRVNKHSLALPCHQKRTEDIVHKNMRMGIGVTGYMQATEEQKTWLSPCYEYLRELDAEYSAIHGFPRSIKLTTVKPSGCMHKDTLVQTTQGLLRLREIGSIAGEEWQSMEGVVVLTDSAGGTARATRFFVNGRADTKKIYTQDGLVLECTLQHRLRVLVRDADDNVRYEWKEAQHIVSGDALAVKFGGYRESSRPVAFRSSGNMPPHLTPQIAWFLGLLVGGGVVSGDVVHFSLLNALDGTRDKLEEILIFIGMCMQRDDSVTDSTLAAWLIENECNPMNGIPMCVRTAHWRMAVWFVEGFRAARVEPSVRMQSEFLALCRALCTTTGEVVLPNGQLWPVCADASRRVLGMWMDPVLRADDSSCDTYDIEVEGVHHYRAGGVVSHNTLSLIGAVTSGCHPGFSRFYIRRIRFSAESPLVQMARDHGYHVEFVENYDGSPDPNTVVIQFPYSLPEHTVIASDCTAIDQLETVRRLQTEWSDNAVSCCLTEDHWVHTARGFVSIDTFCGRQMGAKTFAPHVDDVQVVNSGGEMEPSSHAYFNGEEETVRITLTNGNTIRGTTNHRVKVVNVGTGEEQWKELGHIIAGDGVVCRVGLNVWPPPDIANNIMMQWGEGPVVELTSDLAFWLGCFAAAGEITNDDCVTLHNVRTIHVDAYRKVTRKIFGLATHSEHKNMSVVGASHVVRWLVWMGVYENYVDVIKQVPAVIMQGSRSIVTHFLRGMSLWAASASKSRLNLVTGVGNRMATQIGVLLCNMGVTGDIVSTPDGVGYTYSVSSTTNFYNALRFPPVSDGDNESTYRVVDVRDVEAAGPALTYDISTLDTHSYLANGVVTHNTVYYRREELDDIRAWLNEHYATSVKSVSFLLHSEHGFKQAPLEEITEARYQEMLAGCRPFAMPEGNDSGAALSTDEDFELQMASECAGGACPIR